MSEGTTSPDLSTVLFSRYSAVCELADAHEFAKKLLPDGIRFSTTPARWSAERTNDELDPSVFEVRWFGPSAEIRWRRQSSNGRIAVIVNQGGDASLAEIPAPAHGWEVTEAAQPFRTIQRRFRCWGTVVEVDGNAVVIHEPRIAPVRLPLSATSQDPSEKNRVVINAIELVHTAEYGNARVADTILTSIEIDRKAAP